MNLSIMSPYMVRYALQERFHKFLEVFRICMSSQGRLIGLYGLLHLLTVRRFSNLKAKIIIIRLNPQISNTNSASALQHHWHPDVQVQFIGEHKNIN